MMKTFMNFNNAVRAIFEIPFAILMWFSFAFVLFSFMSLFSHIIASFFI